MKRDRKTEFYKVGKHNEFSKKKRNLVDINKKTRIVKMSIFVWFPTIWDEKIRKKTKELVTTIFLYLKCTNFSLLDAKHIFMLVWISHCTRYNMECDTLAEVPIMLRLRSSFICWGVAFSTRKRAVESDQANVMANLQNHPVILFPKALTHSVSLKMPY